MFEKKFMCFYFLEHSNDEIGMFNKNFNGLHTWNGHVQEEPQWSLEMNELLIGFVVFCFFHNVLHVEVICYCVV
jgi:hypothetical protein